MPLDRSAIQAALARTPGASAEGIEAPHTLLCRREAGAFQRAAKSGEDLLVACTQESRLFLELNAQTEGAAPIEERPIRFVNIRETGGWSKDAQAATPKLAALIAAAQLLPPDPVANVSYRSAGRCLVIGAAAAAERAASMLGGDLEVSLLVEGSGGALAQGHERAVHSGRLTQLSGWLGAFKATWTSDNPIDLDLCTRCNACIAVCPEAAIDFSYRVDLSRCKSHRACVAACDAAGAIDFERAAQSTTESFDLVLDLRAASAFSMHQPPQGYFHVGADASRLFDAVLQLRERVGEFDKPKFFHYKPKLCAHSRNEQIGCTACIDVCSAQAIRSDATLKGKSGGRVRGLSKVTPAAPLPGGQGGGIIVEPQLCVGCGACTTVCPSGALAYATPNTVDHGKRLRTLLGAYRNAGGKDAALLLHSEGAGAKRLGELGRAARVDKAIHGLPARVLPQALWHTASAGIDIWLAAIALGASQVWVLMTDEEAPEYRRALTEQMAVAQAILSGLGYRGEHLRIVSAPEAGDLCTLDRALQAAPAQGVKRPAALALQADKRATLDMVLDHLLAESPNAADVAEEIILPPAGAPFGSLVVDTDKCTLCLSCVGACPEAALADNPDRPQLRFIEKNCVQCGLCEATCPEGAITLAPRLWLADAGKARKAARVLHEVEPFCCVRCGKPFGTLKAIESMIAKVGGHPAFQGAGAERLKMCGDCRVIDIHTNPNELKITDL
jgi:ferredoxin